MLKIQNSIIERKEGTMENLIKTVTQILDTYLKDNVGNRENQWSFRTLKDVVLNEIRAYKPTKKEVEVKEDKKK